MKLGVVLWRDDKFSYLACTVRGLARPVYEKRSLEGRRKKISLVIFKIHTQQEKNSSGMKLACLLEVSSCKGQADSVLIAVNK